MSTQFKVKNKNLLPDYQKANEFMTAERIAFLSGLTPQESLAIFSSQWQVGEQLNGPSGNQDALERRKIKELMDRRRTFDRLASRGNHECN